MKKTQASNISSVDDIKVVINNEEKPVDASGQVKEKNFTIDTTGQTLFKGPVIDKKVEISQKHVGMKITGSVDDILAALRADACKK